jgi:hypothetical protein
MFEAVTYKVELSGVGDPTKRAEKVLRYLDAAKVWIGAKPTHVIANTAMCLDLDLLELGGLQVRYQRMAWVEQEIVRLAVEIPEPGLDRTAGAPARMQAQARLL